MNYKTEENQCDSTKIDMLNGSDDALIRVITDGQANNRNAFSILIARHRNYIYRRCLFRLGNQHDAEDAMQDIVIRISNKLHQYERRAQFKSWLSSVINNYCNTYAKRRARYVTSDHLQQLIELHETGNTSCSDISVSCYVKTAHIDPAEELAEQDILHQALALLPENTRQVLTLRFYADKSLQEISQILHISLSATKARLYRAIEQVKNIYYSLDNPRLC